MQDARQPVIFLARFSFWLPLFQHDAHVLAMDDVPSLQMTSHELLLAEDARCVILEISTVVIGVD